MIIQVAHHENVTVNLLIDNSRDSVREEVKIGINSCLILFWRNYLNKWSHDDLSPLRTIGYWAIFIHRHRKRRIQIKNRISCREFLAFFVSFFAEYICPVSSRWYSITSHIASKFDNERSSHEGDRKFIWLRSLPVNNQSSSRNDFSIKTVAKGLQEINFYRTFSFHLDMDISHVEHIPMDYVWSQGRSDVCWYQQANCLLALDIKPKSKTMELS